jgi:hypothetical protein
MFAEIIEDNIHELAPDCPVAALAAETIVGGIHEVVFGRILAGRIDELPGLVDDLLTTILVLTTGHGGRGTGREPLARSARAATAAMSRSESHGDARESRPAGYVGVARPYGPRGAPE